MSIGRVKLCISRKIWIVFLAVFLAGQTLFSVAWAEISPLLKFAVFCDSRGDSDPNNLYKSGVNEAVLNAIAKAIVKEGAEFVIFPGDLINGWYQIRTPFARQFATWRKAMAPVYDAGIKVYPVRGNHEDGPFAAPGRYPWPPDPAATPETWPLSELKMAYQVAFDDFWIPSNGPAGEKGLTYSFVFKDAFFVGLDQYINPHKVNQLWLDEQLMKNKKPHIFVYGHAPAFRVGHTDSLASYPQERDAFWNSIGNAGAQMYFCGHDHYYNRCHVKGQRGRSVYQVLIGTGGAPLVKWHPKSYPEGDKVVADFHDELHYGYGIVTIDGPRVRMDWKGLFKENGTDFWKTLDVLEYTVK